MLVVPQGRGRKESTFEALCFAALQDATRRLVIVRKIHSKIVEVVLNTLRAGQPSEYTSLLRGEQLLKTLRHTYTITPPPMSSSPS